MHSLKICPPPVVHERLGVEGVGDMKYHRLTFVLLSIQK
jgi:hypothetical protein